MRKRLVNGSIWAFLSRIIGIGLSLVFNMLLARMLSPDEMGAYFIALSLTGIFSIFAQMGLPTAIVRLIAESVATEALGRTKQIIKRALILAFLGGVFIGLIFYLGLGDMVMLQAFHITSLHSTIGLIALFILVNCLQGVVGEIYRGFHEIRAASIIASIVPQLNVLGLALLWWFNRGYSDVQHIFWVTLVSASIGLFVTIGFVQKRVSGLEGSGQTTYREIMGIAWPLCLIQIAVFIAIQADLWIVGAFLTEQDVAIYGAIQKLVMLMTMTHSLVVTVAQSSVAELYAKGEKAKLEKIIQGMAFVACIPAGILFVILIFWGENLLSLIFGDFYRVGIEPLIILCAGHFLGMLLGPAGMVLMMTGQQKKSMYMVITTSLVSIVLAGVLARPFGLVGVATAWSAGGVLYGIGGWLLVHKKLDIKTHIKLLPEMLAWKISK